METSHNTTKLALHNGNKPQHNKISTTQEATMKTSRNTIKLSQHNGNKPQHSEISTINYNPKSEKVGTVWKTQIKKESSDF